MMKLLGWLLIVLIGVFAFKMFQELPTGSAKIGTQQTSATALTKPGSGSV